MSINEDAANEIFSFAQLFAVYIFILGLVYIGYSRSFFGLQSAITWIIFGTAVCFTGVGVIGHRIWLSMQQH